MKEFNEEEFVNKYKEIVYRALNRCKTTKDMADFFLKLSKLTQEFGNKLEMWRNHKDE